MRAVSAALLAAALASPVHSADCPRPAARALKGSRQLILATTDGWDSFKARLRVFERQSAKGAWKEVRPATPAVVGRAGLAWGLAYASLATADRPGKHEGDGRSPAGFYRLGRPFGFSESGPEGWLRLEAGTECVDDPASRFYNRVADAARDKKDWTSSERMREVEAYRRGFLIDYRSNARARAGSCIFAHVWKAPDRGTAGCTASDEATLAFLQGWARPAAKPVIAAVPASELPRFAACLPGVSGE